MKSVKLNCKIVKSCFKNEKAKYFIIVTDNNYHLRDVLTQKEALEKGGKEMFAVFCKYMVRSVPLCLLGFVCSYVLSIDRKSTRLNSSHAESSYAVFCLKKKTTTTTVVTR